MMNAQRGTSARLASARNLPESKDAVLDVHLSTRVLPPGGPLLAGVQLRNVSSREIEMRSGANESSDFDMELTTLTGDSLGEVGPSLVRTSVITLVQGNEWMDVLDVSRAFNLTRPGHYVLRVKRGVSDGEARSVPIAFSVVDGAKPDARQAAVPDPQRVSAEAVTAKLAESAPIVVSGSPTNDLSIAQRESSTVAITLTNRSAKPVHYSWFEWVRMEVEHPDGRTEQIFDQKTRRDNHQLIDLGGIAPQASVEFKTNLQDRYKFPGPGRYVLRFWFPRATGVYTLPVTVKAEN
jgi:hypothetical protein